MKSLMLVAAVVVVGGGALLARKLDSAGKQRVTAEQMLHTVQRGKLTITITENGTLMAKNSEKITFTGRRGGKISFLIDEGKTVEKDEVLCRLETTELEKQVQQLELSVLKTEADLNSAKTELEIQTSDNAAKIEKSRIALTKAQKELEKYRDGDSPKERRKLEVAIKEAQNKHSRAKKKYEDSLVLAEQKYITQSQLEQDEIDYERSEIQLESALQDLQLFDRFTKPMTMTDKQTGVKDSQRERDNAQKRSKSTLRQKEVAVESQERRLKSLTKNLEQVKKEIETCTIKSPAPGIVIYGEPNQPWYRDQIKLGMQVWGGFTLFTIPDLRVMQVQVRVHEADINKVEKEQTVTVTMDTYSGLVLSGKVTKIATIAGGRNRGGSSEVKKFTVDITLDSTGGKTLKPGISAKAEIFVDERDDVLFVPLQCVFVEEGVHYSYVMRDGDQPVRVEVKPDVNNDSFIQIVAGLDQGDRVLLYNPLLHAGTEKLEKPSETEVAMSESSSRP